MTTTTTDRPQRAATLRAKTVFKLIDVCEPVGYRRCADGTFPIPPIYVGRLLRFSRAAVRESLAVDDDELDLRLADVEAAG